MENKEGLNILLALGLGTLALLIMAIAVIFFIVIHQRRVIAHQLVLNQKEEEMQREMLRATIQSQEAEQRRIARDLHDDLGPMLSAVKLKISRVKKAMDEKAFDVADIDESKSMLDVTINQVRNISHQLLPPILEDYGLISAIESACAKISSDKLEVLFTHPSEYNRLSMEMELAIYRVIMELLNNIIKHSGATKATVSILQQDGKIEIKVSDNGKGFNPDSPGKTAGLGLKNIQSRLKAINAIIAFESSPAGTTALIKLNTV